MTPRDTRRIRPWPSRRVARALVAGVAVAALGAATLTLAVPHSGHDAAAQPATPDVVDLPESRLAAVTGRSSRAQSPSTLARTATAPVRVRVGTFNVLSSWHTRVGRGEAWMAPGPMRAHLAAEAIRLYDADVVGLQELDLDQLGPMAAQLPDYNFYPGNRLSHRGVNNNILWNTTEYVRLDGGYLMLEFLNEDRAVPYILLRHRDSGRRFWVMNVHNTPKRGGDPRLTEERKRQVAAEIAKVRQLQASGLPVFLTGDLNDRDYSYCQFVSRTLLRAAQGYPGGCTLPRDFHIEWVLGARVDWMGYDYDRGPLVSRVTDHPVLFATATLR